MEEIWKPILGYEGLYEVGNLGNVRSLKFNKKTLVIPQDNGHGYVSAHLRKKPINKRIYIHRLVACAFISNKENKPCINHIDNNRSNNIDSNLEWVTSRENDNYKIIQNRQARGEKSNHSTLREMDILEIRDSKKRSILLAKQYNLSREHIDRIKRKATWSWLS